MVITYNTIAEWCMSFTIVGIFCELIGVHSVIIWLLFIFVGVDFITGAIAHYIDKTFNYDALWAGLVKKCVYPFVVITGLSLQLLAYQYLPITVEEIAYIAPLIMLTLISIELTSIFNNLRKCGIEIPQLLSILEFITKGKKG